MILASRSLTSGTNEIRKAAEASFEQLCNNPESVLPLLCASLTQSEDETVRAMTAVMFRKRVSEAFYEKLSPDSQAAVKSTLISAVQQERVPGVRRKVADTAGEVAAMILGKSEWPELLTFLFQIGKSEFAEMRESCMLILARLTFAVSDKLLPVLPQLSNLFHGTLQDAQSKEVRLAALSAASSLIQALSNLEEQLQGLHVLIPAMFGVVSAALNDQDQESARSALEDLISVAEEAPKFFRRSMDPLVSMCFTIADAKQLENETRFLAVEMLLTLSEQAPAMMRKQTLFLSNIVPLALQLMLSVEELDPVAWNSTTDDDDDDDMTRCLEIPVTFTPSLEETCGARACGRSLPVTSAACGQPRKPMRLRGWTICEARGDGGAGRLWGVVSSLDVGKDCLDRLALSIGGKTIFAQVRASNRPFSPRSAHRIDHIRPGPRIE